jgi:hypothetical protein
LVTVRVGPQEVINISEERMAVDKEIIFFIKVVLKEICCVRFLIKLIKRDQ